MNLATSMIKILWKTMKAIFGLSQQICLMGKASWISHRKWATKYLWLFHSRCVVWLKLWEKRVKKIYYRWDFIKIIDCKKVWKGFSSSSSFFCGALGELFESSLENTYRCEKKKSLEFLFGDLWEETFMTCMRENLKNSTFSYVFEFLWINCRWRKWEEKKIVQNYDDNGRELNSRKKNN